MYLNNWHIIKDMNIERVKEMATELYATLGPGLSELAYCKALGVCLVEAGIPFQAEVVLPVTFRGVQIATLRCDILLADMVIEAKAVATLTATHRQQLKTYMKLLPEKVGLLINFGPTLDMELMT